MVQLLTGPRLARALRAGALAVVREQETLNRINVFPVPDADTGANLASTLRAAAAALAAPNELTVGQTVRTAADAALDGARGNSGAIFAQFLYGMAESIGNRVERHHAGVRGRRAARHRGGPPGPRPAGRGHDSLGAEGMGRRARGADRQDPRLRRAAREGPRPRARGARQHPASSWRSWPVTASWTPGPRGSCTSSRVSPPSSATAGPPAGGGRGSPRRSRRRSPPRTPSSTPRTGSAPRGCSRASGSTARRSPRRSTPLGGSLVVAGGGSRLRVHLHTNEPQRLFTLLADFGDARAHQDRRHGAPAAGGARGHDRPRERFVVRPPRGDRARHRAGEGAAHLELWRRDVHRRGRHHAAPVLPAPGRLAACLPRPRNPRSGTSRPPSERLLENHEGIVSLAPLRRVSRAPTRRRSPQRSRSTRRASASSTRVRSPSRSASWRRRSARRLLPAPPSTRRPRSLHV